MNWVRSRRWALYTVTVRVQSFLPKIRLFIQSQSIYRQNTTLSITDKIFEKICGSKNPADMLTKGVTIEKLKLCAVSGLLAWGQEDELQGWGIFFFLEGLRFDVGDWTSLQVGDLLGFVVMGVTRLRPLDEVNNHDEIIPNDEETSHHWQGQENHSM